MSYINIFLIIFSSTSLLGSIFVFFKSAYRTLSRTIKLERLKQSKKISNDSTISYIMHDKVLIPVNTMPNNVALSLLECNSNTIIAYINEFPCVVGRSKKADVEIKNDDFISNLHILFTRQIESIYIEDLGSSNGTFINNTRLTSKHMIENGDKIKIGDTEITLLIDDIFDENRPQIKYTKVLKHNDMVN